MSEEEFKPQLTGLQMLVFFSGVILPAISITVEASTAICAETFFDPIPTVWHLLIVVLVPLAHLHIWFVIRRGTAARLRLAGFANVFTIGVSLFYSIVYLPLLPLAALTIPVLLGFLPLAPFFSLFAGIVMRRQLKRMAHTQPEPSFGLTKAGMVLGLSLTIGAIGLIELPSTLTRHGLQMAASDSEETRAKGVRFLRSYGSREYLLRASYGRSGIATDLAGYLLSTRQPVTTEEARKIYYRVTGETFDSSPPPRRLRRGWMGSDFLFDVNLGGPNVGPKVKGLALSTSKIDVSADADGGLAYMQWTLLFVNHSVVQQEARAEIQLPPGSVVSRLTLWVDGEEREAAFAGRSKVRQAYEQVVRQRRDPVLVTTAGRDRILVQCFPVPPSAGAMRIRLGITTPLMLENPIHARLLFPNFLSKNFEIPNDVKHALWVESISPMIASDQSLKAEYPPRNVYALRGAVPEASLSQANTSVRLNRSNLTQMWAKNSFESEGFIVRQSIEERPPNQHQRIVLVLDTSIAMLDWIPEVERALGSLSPQFDVNLVLAGDEPYSYESKTAEIPTFSGKDEIAKALAKVTVAGGADNTPALMKAWDLAASKPGINAIVWVHAPQRVQLQSVEELRQRWERRPYGPSLYSLRTTNSPDEIEKALDGIAEVKSVPRLGTFSEDLKRLLEQLTNQTQTFVFVRTSERAKPPAASEAIQTSDHLARLWANDEVARILSARDESLKDAATALAVRYQLVTPVSGAVVLESAAQYDAAGLKPVDPGTVPTIPEPEMVALLVLTLMLLTFLVYRHYRIQRI